MPRKQDVGRRQGAIWDALAQGDPDKLAIAISTRAPEPNQQRAREHPERDLVQRPLVVYLRRHLPEGSIVFAVPNLARSREHLYTLVRDGMLPGIPDLCVLTTHTNMICGDDEDHSMIPHTRPWVGFIECKRPDGGVLTDTQSEVQALIAALGFPILSECRSIPEAREWLQSHGIKIA